MSLFTALYGSRFAVQCSDAFARAIGYPASPIDDLLVFNTVFGKTVPDISLNAIANLGYAECASSKPSIRAIPRAHFRNHWPEGKFQRQKRHGLCALTRRQSAGRAGSELSRWVMVNKREEKRAAPEPHVPSAPEVVPAARRGVPNLNLRA